jgi:hypothetical protein
MTIQGESQAQDKASAIPQSIWRIPVEKINQSSARHCDLDCDIIVSSEGNEHILLPTVYICVGSRDNVTTTKDARSTIF